MEPSKWELEQNASSSSLTTYNGDYGEQKAENIRNQCGYYPHPKGELGQNFSFTSPCKHTIPKPQLSKLKGHTCQKLLTKICWTQQNKKHEWNLSISAATAHAHRSQMQKKNKWCCTEQAGSKWAPSTLRPLRLDAQATWLAFQGGRRSLHRPQKESGKRRAERSLWTRFSGTYRSHGDIALLFPLRFTWLLYQGRFHS